MSRWMASRRGERRISSLYRAFRALSFGTSSARVPTAMINRRSPFSIFVAALFLVAALPSLARADTASSRVTLDPAQLDSFAALVGEETSTVAQRIAADPSLVPFAAKAADARMRRKHTGKLLTITGFTIFGVGTAIGLEVIISGSRPVNCPNSTTNGCDSGGNVAQVGLAIALVSEAVGLALAIPGIVKMASQSEAETEASARYHPLAATNDGSTSPSWSTQSLRAGMPEASMRPSGVLLPLLSGTF